MILQCPLAVIYLDIRGHLSFSLVCPTMFTSILFSKRQIFETKENDFVSFQKLWKR